MTRQALPPRRGRSVLRGIQQITAKFPFVCALFVLFSVLFFGVTLLWGVYL